MTANALAWLALAAWPLAAISFFAVSRRTGRPARATAWMLLLPHMLLPSNLFLKTPGIPALDKNRIAVLAVVIGLELFYPVGLGERIRAHVFPRAMLLLLVAGIAQTVWTNSDTVVIGRTVLPALTDYELLSMSMALVLDVYLPFAIGQRVFRTVRDLRDILDVLGRCTLIYAPLVLLELRLSPQLHRWVYGYHPSEFIQAVRGGGFRATVFMNHGLVVAMFLFSGFCASIALYMARVPSRPAPRLSAIVSGILLILNRSFGAIIYALAAFVLQSMRSPRTIGRVVAISGLVVISYPVLRTVDAIPAVRIVSFFEGINPERAQSLQFRFDQEERLLSRAMQRPMFGWGGWAATTSGRTGEWYR